MIVVSILINYITKDGKSTEITNEINNDLSSFSLNDNEDGTLDDINITLDNKQGLWSGNWRPKKGDQLEVRISKNENNIITKKFAGVFSIDELTTSLFPKQIQIKAISVPLVTSIRKLKKTRGYEETTLSQIAQGIADEGKLNLIFSSELDPEFLRIEQNEKSDLKFLKDLCEEYSLSLKITDNQIVIFNQKENENKNPIKTITPDLCTSFNMTSSAYDKYKSCIVSYFDADQEKIIETEIEDPDIEEGEIFKINKRVESIDQAKKLATAKLRRLNKANEEGSVTIAGDTSLYAGGIVELSGFELDDGKYIISKLSDTINANNFYSSNLSIRRIKTI